MVKIESNLVAKAICQLYEVSEYKWIKAPAITDAPLLAKIEGDKAILILINTVYILDKEEYQIIGNKLCESEG